MFWKVSLLSIGDAAVCSLMVAWASFSEISVNSGLWLFGVVSGSVGDAYPSLGELGAEVGEWGSKDMMCLIVDSDSINLSEGYLEAQVLGEYDEIDWNCTTQECFGLPALIKLRAL